MNGELFGRFAAGHRAGSDFVPAVSLVVVAIHRRFFAFCEGMMMGRDGAMVAGATYAAGYGQSRNNRTLKQQGREEANERRHAAARERITEMAGELHSATSVLSIIRQKPAAGPPERAFLQNAPRLLTRAGRENPFRATWTEATPCVSPASGATA